MDSHRRTQRARRRRGHPAREQDPDRDGSGVPGWEALQRTAGNRATRQILPAVARSDLDPDRPASVLARLGRGDPLPTTTRARMEAAYGDDLGHVRVHTDGADADVANALGARAVTVGRHVAFAPGEFRPGTPAGDAMLAHELAHVQQQDERSIPGGSTPDGSTRGAETDATTSAAGVVAGLWASGTSLARNLAGSVRPRLRTGLSLHRCTTSVEKREPPAYLGEHSRQCLEDMQDIESSIDLASALIVFGATTGAASPEGVAGEAAGVAATGESTLVHGVPNAMLDLFIIKGARIMQRIQILLITHDNDLNAQEKAFWRRVLARVGEQKARATDRRRR